MTRSIERELLRFIWVWRVLGPAVVVISLWMVLLSWPDQWLAWLVFISTLFFGFLIFRQTRMARRALHVVRHVEPENCLVEIHKESGDNRDYVKGTVYVPSEIEWKMSFAPPIWNVDPILQKTLPAKVYFERKTQHPLVVVVEGGHLWAETVPISARDKHQKPSG